MTPAQAVRERAPMTVAAFMDLALYHPEFGYYARAARRSGRAGDFFTSVDVGPLFGMLLEIQLAEMYGILEQSAVGNRPSVEPRAPRSEPREASREPRFDLVEAGAGSGRLSADVLRAARDRDPAFYDSIRLHLVEASPLARDAQRAELADVAGHLSSSSASLPDSFEGVLFANELFDAMPVHQVVMTERGLREIYVHASQPAVDSRQSSPADGRLTTVQGPPSTPRLAAYLAAVGARLEPGWRAEIGLHAIDWMRDAARRMRRGFMIVVDYGHEARELYSVTHATGTLTTFSGHHSSGPESPEPSWLQDPGARDITAHVDFTSLRAAAEAEGMVTVGFLDQTYFVLGLCSDWDATRLAEHASAIKTLMVPGGLGSTMKVLILGKGVGTPALRGCSFKLRVT